MQESLTNAERKFRHPDALLVKPSTESDHEPSLTQETPMGVSFLVEKSCIQLQDRTQRTFDLPQRYFSLPAFHRTDRTTSASLICTGRLFRTIHAVNSCNSNAFPASYEVLRHSSGCGMVYLMPISALGVLRDQHVRQKAGACEPSGNWSRREPRLERFCRSGAGRPSGQSAL